ncbi:7510_t:CDS:1 [Scutellospora calospora]|uniref:7510_t:CDS:1 n=1 Tax=Scutellospora calospora TaxID=85575 RepID=A0ACA9MX92_9GLOM|nr:7510_t:CDS:1 [Scutellospora calospora]
MLYNFATPESPGFKYLYLFKEEFHADMSEILREGLTIRRVCEIILQNLDKKMLADYKIKLTRFDEIAVFDLEIPDQNDWIPEESEWFGIKDFLFFAGKNFQTYKFM